MSKEVTKSKWATRQLRIFSINCLPARVTEVEQPQLTTPKQRGSRPQLSVLVKECTVNVQNEVVQMETQNLAGPFKRCPFTSTALCSPLCCHSLSMLAQPCHLTTRGKKMSFRMPKCFCFPSQSVNPQLWVNKYKSRKWVRKAAIRPLFYKHRPGNGRCTPEKWLIP